MLLPTVYEDAGISGGTLERPGLQRLLDDIDAGRSAWARVASDRCLCSAKNRSSVTDDVSRNDFSCSGHSGVWEN